MSKLAYLHLPPELLAKEVLLAMPRVVTDVHDPVALARVCELLDLPLPVERAITLAGEEVFGWVVRLRGRA